MSTNRAWVHYQNSYREKEITILLNWLKAGYSGAVVGLTGSGKSNLLGFLCHRFGTIQADIGFETNSFVLIPVDLNNLPDDSLATFYRVILRAFYEVREQFDKKLQETILDLYQTYKTTQDAFLPQSALRELLLEFQLQEKRVVLVIDRFDEFCLVATPQMTSTLRGLRDSFKNMLYYIVGMRQEAAYLPDPAILGELYEILDTHTCWVGPMSQVDAQQLIAKHTQVASTPPNEDEILALLTLTGGYPALLKTACHWWLQISPKPPLTEWWQILFHEPSIQYRLQEIWSGLNQEERFVLFELQKQGLQNLTTTQEMAHSPVEFTSFEKRHPAVLAQLAKKGCCQKEEERWFISGGLLTTYVGTAAGRGRGKIWADKQKNEIYQGHTLLTELSPLEQAVINFLIENPYARHTKTDLIISTWPDELRKEGVTDDSLYQVITGLRRKIEPFPSKPCYIINWRGRPEGGYQFYPEGRPG